MVDVDGTLAGVYRNGRRPLRETAPAALELLSQAAPVILWSTGGPDNCLRLLAEYPELDRYVCHVAHKIGFPVWLIYRPYCIDDNESEDAVFQCERVIIDTLKEGKDSGQLIEAAQLIAQDIRSRNG
jgi:hypothetical protein